LHYRIIIISERLAAEDIDIHEGVQVKRVVGNVGAITIEAEIYGITREFNASHLLLAVGRSPNLHKLDLNVAGIEVEPDGILVDASLRRTFTTQMENLGVPGQVGCA